jgi:aarF domain-containing kinase
VFGVDSLLWAVRFARRLLLWSQAVAVASIQASPRAIVSSTWESWADAHRTAAAQAERLSLTEAWLDSLFDVHGHQIFNLGLFNADPHPGNILVIEEEGDGPSTRLGLIDYGQCKRLTVEEQVKIAQLVLSVANEKSDLAVATAFRSLGITTKNNLTEFLAKFGRLMFGPLKPEHLDHSWHRKLHEQDRVLYFPKELSMVYRTSLLLRGLGVSLQLNYSVGDQWRHHAQEAVDRNPQIVLKLKEEQANDLTTNQPINMSFLVRHAIEFKTRG